MNCVNVEIYYVNLTLLCIAVITYEMLQSWIHHKAKDGSFWQSIVSSESVLRIAFSIASKPNPDNAEQSIIGITSFRAYLVHLFVLSILWVHFKHADEWTEGQDLGTERLSLQKFKMACRTFSSAQAHEHVTDESLQADFEMLDADNSGTIEFAEVLRMFILLLCVQGTRHCSCNFFVVLVFAVV